MISFSNFAQPLRENKLEMHCHQLELSQQDKDDGFKLHGYGVIKTHDSGGIFADIVITHEDIELPWGRVIPSDPFDETGYFTLSALTLAGTEIKSHGIKVQTEPIYCGNQAKRFIIPLASVEVVEPTYGADLRKWKRCVQIEFKEKSDVPVNKCNTSESSLGEKSLSWNQVLIENEDYVFDMVNKDGYTSAYIATNSKDLDTIYAIVLFYIGFTSGIIPQPYILQRTDELTTVTSLRPYDNSQVRRKIPPPTISNVLDQNGCDISERHYRLLDNLIRQYENNKRYFECIYSHWLRIWHAFQSKADTVPGVTLTTSIEGILNDIFIPRMERLFKDKALEGEKLRIIEIINNLDTLNNDQRDSIKTFINRWGNLYPEKALGILVERGVLKDEEKRVWVKLRHTLAHPRIGNHAENRNKILSGRVLTCLGIFYKLVFLLYKYDGVFVDFGSETRNRISQFTFSCGDIFD